MNLTNHESSDNRPVWSPDGRRLVCIAAVPAGAKGDTDLPAVPVEGGGKPILLAGNPQREQRGSRRPR